MASAAASIRERVAGGGSPHQRVKQVDRLADRRHHAGRDLHRRQRLVHLPLHRRPRPWPLFRSARRARQLAASLTLAAPAQPGRARRRRPARRCWPRHRRVPDVPVRAAAGRAARVLQGGRRRLRARLRPARARGHRRHRGRPEPAGDYVAAGTADGRVALAAGPLRAAATRTSAWSTSTSRCATAASSTLDSGEARRCARWPTGARELAARSRPQLVGRRDRGLSQEPDDATRASATACAPPDGETRHGARARPRPRRLVGRDRDRATSIYWELDGEPRAGRPAVSPVRAAPVTALAVLAGQQLGDRRRRGRRRLRLVRASASRTRTTDLSLVTRPRVRGPGQADRRHRPSDARQELRHGRRRRRARRCGTSRPSARCSSFPATGVRPVDALMTPQAPTASWCGGATARSRATRSRTRTRR